MAKKYLTFLSEIHNTNKEIIKVIFEADSDFVIDNINSFEELGTFDGLDEFSAEPMKKYQIYIKNKDLFRLKEILPPDSIYKIL